MLALKDIRLRLGLGLAWACHIWVPGATDRFVVKRIESSAGTRAGVTVVLAMSNRVELRRIPLTPAAQSRSLIRARQSKYQCAVKSVACILRTGDFRKCPGEM